jgi:isopenicillin-N epimerase
MKHLFLLDPSVTFLNHGSYGAVPRPVFEQWQRWQLETERNPVLFLARRSGSLLRQARERLGAWLGANADDLVFLPNATTGVNTVAKSLRLAPGDEVLTNDLEYGACLATWQRVCDAQGARLRVVRIALPLTREGFVGAMTGAMTDATRVVFMSHITSPTALILPIEPVLAEARLRGIFSLVDGAHAPAQLELDLDALGADGYTGNCHKWLCAPKGTAFLHARPEHHAMLHAGVTSWGYVAGDGPSPRDAYLGSGLFERRMQWQGTRDLSGYLAVPSAIEFQLAHDWPAQRRRCHAMAIDLLHRVAARTGMAPIAADHCFAQMVPLEVMPQDGAVLGRRLFDDHRIEVPVTQHDGRSFVRVSVQAYNSDEDLARLEQALEALGQFRR